MGRSTRFAYYYIKKFALIAFVIWGGMHVTRYAGDYYDANVQAVAQQAILPNIVTVDAKGVEEFLNEKGNITIIYIYSSRSLLSRWYFDNFNAMAAKYSKAGVRILFLSVDDDINSLANFLATQGQLYFTPLYMIPQDKEKFIGIISRLDGDPFGGALPYMGVLNQQKFLRDFSLAIVRTGKIDAWIQQSIRGS